jgi:hypothetical protein
MACSRVNIPQGNLTLNRVPFELSFVSQDREFLFGWSNSEQFCPSQEPVLQRHLACLTQ